MIDKLHISFGWKMDSVKDQLASQGLDYIGERDLEQLKNNMGSMKLSGFLTNTEMNNIHKRVIKHLLENCKEKESVNG